MRRPGICATRAMARRLYRGRLRQSPILSQHADLGRSHRAQRLLRRVRRRAAAAPCRARVPAAAGRIYAPLRVTPGQYRRLVDFIRPRFRLDARGRTIPVLGRGYNDWDMFYEAQGGYSFVLTCNEWTGAPCAPRACGSACGRRWRRASCGGSIDGLTWANFPQVGGFAMRSAGNVPIFRQAFPGADDRHRFCRGNRMAAISPSGALIGVVLLVEAMASTARRWTPTTGRDSPLSARLRRRPVDRPALLFPTSCRSRPCRACRPS